MDIRAATDTVRNFWLCHDLMPQNPRHRYALVLVRETACDAKAEAQTIKTLDLATIIQELTLQ